MSECEYCGRTNVKLKVVDEGYGDWHDKCEEQCWYYEVPLFMAKRREVMEKIPRGNSLFTPETCIALKAVLTEVIEDPETK